MLRFVIKLKEKKISNKTSTAISSIVIQTRIQ